MRYLYINPNASTGPARATVLGCGWMAAVPPEFASITVAPCVILSGAGQTVVIPDSPPTNAAAVVSAAAPIQALEAAAAATAATQATNAQTLQQNTITALASNATYLALATPTTAQNTAQIKALTRQIDALIRLVANQLDSTAGT
jgi:hypothetical protein